LEEQRAARSAASAAAGKEREPVPETDTKKEEPAADSGSQGLSLVSMDDDDKP
jgi:hypothetical protein